MTGRRVVRAREAKKKLSQAEVAGHSSRWDGQPPAGPSADLGMGSGLPVPGPREDPRDAFWREATTLVRELTRLVRLVIEEEEK